MEPLNRELWNSLSMQRGNYVSMCLAPNTQRTYRTGVNHYRQFCTHLGVATLPLNENVLELFCVSLARRVGHKSIRVYLCGVQLESTLSGFSQHIKAMGRLHYVLRGIKIAQGQSHNRTPRVPVTLPNLRTILHMLNLNYPPHDRDMLSSAILLAFFGLFRVSEYTSPSPTFFQQGSTLCLPDIQLNFHRKMIYINLKVSKTDPFRCGVVVRISGTGSEICPFRALVKYFRSRGSSPGPLFMFSDGSYLTREHVRHVLQTFIPTENVNTHSLRQGGASALAAIGVSPYVIQHLGRWSSDAYTRYIQFSDNFISDANRAMSKGPH